MEDKHQKVKGEGKINSWNSSFNPQKMHYSVAHNRRHKTDSKKLVPVRVRISKIFGLSTVDVQLMTP